MNFYRFINHIHKVQIVLSSELIMSEEDLIKAACLESYSILFRMRRERENNIKRISKSIGKEVPLILLPTPLEQSYKSFPIGWDLQVISISSNHNRY